MEKNEERDGECEEEEWKKREDGGCKEGMHACLLCLLNKAISLAGVFITFLRT